MTSRERMILAMRNEKPDMVPVAPDISNMIPCKMTGKPFWDIYFHGRPRLWHAYIEAVKYFKFDGWFIYGRVKFKAKREIHSETKTVYQDDEKIVRRTVHRTPAGELSSERTFRRWDPPVTTEGLIKDLKEDFPKLKYLYPKVEGYEAGPLEAMRKELGELGALGAGVGLPGFQSWTSLFNGGLENLVYTYYDYPELMEELRRSAESRLLRQAEMILEAKPDFFMIGASGLLSLQSPEIVRRLSLPTLKKITIMAKDAGVPSLLHSCGKERYLVEVCVKETELSCINPLEPPPMGDCDLKEIKRSFGRKIALMGNLHTTEVMLKGRAADVEREAKKCIDDAGEGGGFILSTGDQCGRDTPFENIFKLVEVARSYGKY